MTDGHMDECIYRWTDRHSEGLGDGCMESRIDTDKDTDRQETAEDQGTARAFQYERRTGGWMDIQTDMDSRTDNKPLKQMDGRTY